MQFYYYIFLLMGLSVTVGLIRSVILWRRNEPVELYVEALRNENIGQFKEALIVYESALVKFQKIGFHREFKNKIIEKIKLLRTVIDYQRNSTFSR
jgi:hypothetical protein